MKLCTGVTAVAALGIAMVATADVVVKGQTATKKVVVEEIAQDIVEVRVLAKTGANTWTVACDVTQETNDAEAEGPALLLTADCNDNGVDDATDIASGMETDFDHDARPDSCEAAAGDTNLDGTVNQLDVSVVLGWWGLGYSPTSDANQDGLVDGHDLGLVLAAFGSAPGTTH